MHEVDNSLLEPYTYLSNIPGKDVRGILIDCFQRYLSIPPSTLCVIKDIISSLHNASLLIDDIEDSSRLRRGLPVAHTIFGIASTINCANYVYFLALQKCYALQNAEATNVFIQELLRLHRGQGQDILWRDTCKCPTEKQYEEMVLDKTGGLFRLAVGLMQAFSSQEKRINFTPLLDLLGLYFQIRDDYVNLASIEYMQSKSMFEDITEGKFSFPIIHAIRSHPEDSTLLNILRQRTEDMALKSYAVQWLKKNKSFEYTRQRLRALYQNILCTIEAAGGEGKESLTSLIMHLESQLDGATLNKTAAAIPSVEFDTRHLAREDPVGNDGDDDNKFLVMGARHGDGLSNL